MQKLALAVASMGFQQSLDVQLASSPKATMPASTKGSCIAIPSIDEEKLMPTKELALKLVGFK